MHNNGAVSLGDPGKIPLPPALTQRIRPTGGDGSSLPLEPFRFLRSLRVNRPATASAQSAPEPEPAEEPLPFEEAFDEPLPFEEPEELEAQWSAADFAAEDDLGLPALDEDFLKLSEIESASSEPPFAAPSATDANDATRNLAERFERLSQRLRDESLESLLPSLAGGDRFDTLVAGFLAGYFSAKNA
jgi:hypothetical protein